MIRKLRIALANWIMPEPELLSAERTAEMFREIMAMSEQRTANPRRWKPGAEGYAWARYPFRPIGQLDGSGPVGDEI